MLSQVDVLLFAGIATLILVLALVMWLVDHRRR